MNSEKKIKFNGMDLFIVIVFIAVLAAAVYFFAVRDGAGSVTFSNVSVKATVELKAKNEDYASAIKPGDKVMIGEKEKMTTTVEKVEVKPAKTTGYDIIDGRVLNSTVPNEYDVQVTVAANGVETDKSVEIDGMPIRVGQNAVMFGKGWSSAGYVINVEVNDKQQ